ncbi:MAG: hypothetical protein RL095_2103 [Verrucomicrobiota bacterium]|jgi:thiol-disulfide isomerase/thioredoxin
MRIPSVLFGLMLAASLPLHAQGPEKVDVKKIKKGDLVPEISARDLAGQETRLSQQQGKPVLLIFSSTTCGPCLAELPQMAKMIEKWKSRGLVAINIMHDKDPAQVKTYLSKHPELSWPCWIASTGGWNDPAFRAFSVRGIPSHAFIDPDGRVICGDLNGAALEAAMEEYFDGKIAPPKLDLQMTELQQALAGEDKARLRKAMSFLAEKEVDGHAFNFVLQQHLRQSPRRHPLECLLAWHDFSETTVRAIYDNDKPLETEVLLAHAAYDIQAWAAGDALIAHCNGIIHWQEKAGEFSPDPEALLLVKRRRALLLQDAAGQATLLDMARRDSRREVQEATLKDFAALSAAELAPLRDWLSWQEGADPASFVQEGKSVVFRYQAEATPFANALKFSVLVQVDESQEFPLEMRHDGSRSRWKLDWIPPAGSQILRLKFVDETGRCDNRKRQLKLKTN